MSNLSVFLNPVTTQEEKEVVISNRFVNEDGTLAPFKIRALTQEENDKITKQSTRQIKVNGQIMEKMDSTEYAKRIIVAATIEPNFAQKELCDHYGVMDPLLVPGKMLLSGEYNRLIKEITALSGFDLDIEEAAKN